MTADSYADAAVDHFYCNHHVASTAVARPSLFGCVSRQSVPARARHLRLFNDSLPKAKFISTRFFLIFDDAPEQILKHETSTADEIAVLARLPPPVLRPPSCLLLHPPNISSLFA